MKSSYLRTILFQICAGPYTALLRVTSMQITSALGDTFRSRHSLKEHACPSAWNTISHAIGLKISNACFKNHLLTHSQKWVLWQRLLYTFSPIHDLLKSYKTSHFYLKAWSPTRRHVFLFLTYLSHRYSCKTTFFPMVGLEDMFIF